LFTPKELALLLSASAHLRIRLSAKEWRLILQALPAAPTVDLASWVISSASMYGYLEEPSTIEYLAAVRRTVEGLQAQQAHPPSPAVQQASEATNLLVSAWYR
jgi:hypothetical protein